MNWRDVRWRTSENERSEQNARLLLVLQWGRALTNVDELEEGGVRVRHGMLDTEWLLRHVLSYGPEAKLVEPAWMQERLLGIAERFAGASRAGQR